MNPYVIPGLEATPYAPLCPHRDEQHDTFYVQVDGTETEYSRFRETMNSVPWLTEKGRLVVVTGEPGCGKTSLIHRCAAWLRDELAKVHLTGEIFTLTDSGEPNQSMMLRMEHVVTDLVDNLRDERRGISLRHIEALELKIREAREIQDTSDRQVRHAALMDRVYRYLMNDALPADRVAIVLLPPSSDLVDEIKSYAGFSRHPRMVFFAETDYIEAVHRTWHTITMSDRMAPILLEVGPLNARDGWIYAHARQKSYPADGSFRRVSEETMLRVTREGVRSVRWLHKLLHGVYEDLATLDTPEGLLPLREVTFEQIAEYFFRLKFGEPGNLS
jgi:energy-coupling factor transporter ATP-binding protein EcfA2